MTAWTPDSRAAAVDAVLSRAPVLPVIAIDALEQAVPLARALVDAGLPVLEVTLRSSIAVEAIRRMAGEVPDAIVGAGTVLNAVDLANVVAAGARFAISPGATEAIYEAADSAPIPLIPAIATASELMRGMERGHRRFKFFPAESSGGIGALKGFAGPFAQVRFCPTGGIDAARAPAYLALPNVITLGGSWMVPGDALKAGDYARIGELARAAAALRD
jgi:2-dehydro-3-deoxyphosphogluconate aldolase / (4S)-4-hydroxy-2-oxoglutarate aldolase